MMFNYNVGSTPADIMAEFEAEQLPLVMAGGTFCQSNKLKPERSVYSSNLLEQPPVYKDHIVKFP